MLLVYTILYLSSAICYYIGYEIIASAVMMSLAIFLCVNDIKVSKRYINVRGLFALGFIGGFGLSLLKLSKLSDRYSMLTFLAVFVAYFAFYIGTFCKNKNNVKNKSITKNKLVKVNCRFLSQEILLIVLMLVTFISFIIEVAILKFVPIFTVSTPHAYSTFHVYIIHYFTTFYAFVSPFAICNYYVVPKRKLSRIFIIISFVYVIIMAILMISRSQLILSMVLSAFVIILHNKKGLKKILLTKRNITTLFFISIIFLVLYLLITINRAHNIEYLKGIFEIKNDKMPIFIIQPYMYIAHNFENLNYMINNVFRWTFGRRVLYPFFTLTFIKKLFPIVTESPAYIIKTELSTVTMIYDFYYDFGLVGVIVFCYLIGYIGKTLEDFAYKVLNNEENYKNNYVLILFSLYSYYMLFSFFQTYFSLTDTWVYIIILLLISFTFRMTKERNIKN